MIGWQTFSSGVGLGDRPCDLGSMVECLVVALAEITPPELKVLKGVCKYIIIVQIYYVSSIVLGELLCLFRFFWRVWISAMWKLASSHWRVLLLRRSGDPQFFGNEAKYDFFHNDGWKVFFPHCILNHTGRTVLWSGMWNDLVFQKIPTKDPPDVFFFVKPTFWWFLRLAVFVVSMAWARRMPVPGVFVWRF